MLPGKQSVIRRFKKKGPRKRRRANLHRDQKFNPNGLRGRIESPNKNSSCVKQIKFARALWRFPRHWAHSSRRGSPPRAPSVWRPGGGRRGSAGAQHLPANPAGAARRRDATGCRPPPAAGIFNTSVAFKETKMLKRPAIRWAGNADPKMLLQDRKAPKTRPHIPFSHTIEIVLRSLSRFHEKLLYDHPRKSQKHPQGNPHASTQKKKEKKTNPCFMRLPRYEGKMAEEGNCVI